jgi:hypothetical protein
MDQGFVDTTGFRVGQGGPQQQFRGGQSQLVQMLQSRAQGNDSVAAEMLRRQGEQTARQAMALARATGGSNPGRSLRLALNAGNEARLQANEQAGQVALQEQANALGALGGVLGQARSQDIGMMTTDAGLGLQGALGAQQLRQQQQQSMLAALLGMDAAQLDANTRRGALNQQAALAQQGYENADDNYWRNLAVQFGSGAIGGLSGGLSAALMRGVPPATTPLAVSPHGG